MGESYVLFRGNDMKPNLLNSTCPHLGANLAIEGKVVGNSIECPFHGWRFSGEGKCESIPYSKSVPEFVFIPKLKLLERNGFIFAQINSDNEELNWEPPIINELNDNFGWKIDGTTNHEITCHCQEIPEVKIKKNLFYKL